ncbi:hypothetical protein OF83DRAFT_343507 [Amylostereum chailletii]|nr:hypothetical protein OF83DRAFT_343507 [Amylostereum chailletii]
MMQLSNLSGAMAGPPRRFRRGLPISGGVMDTEATRGTSSGIPGIQSEKPTCRMGGVSNYRPRRACRNVHASTVTTRVSSENRPDEVDHRRFSWTTKCEDCQVR